jgi:triacylglycerol esterase/lipase EstA (alpha/beta hydrolase family)
MDAFRSVAGEVMTRVSGAASVTIMGHSLGGALATLCADFLATAGMPIANVVTFGSPRVGNGKFARGYNEELADLTLRIVNARDPVPHVPWMLGTYRHVATQVYLNNLGSAVMDAPLLVAAAELGQTLGSITTQQAAQAALDIAKPHHIGSYLGKLKALTA